MAIYRGAGGAGDATQDATSEVLLALQAKDAAIAAQVAAEAAQAAAETAETNAETAETNAETAETNAETAATNAANSASAASTSATNAASSASAASTSASNASTSATNASNSASAASTSASNAASSASSASTSASTATTQATNAATSASAAATSATNAAGSATAAATSASNAATSATSASGSASTATTQATNASNSASAASTSASNAASSASAAATSASNAASSATSAAGSATTATTQATNASNSATAASTSATNAANSATAAATSATNAANSATSAATSATNAANSATAAAASAASINPASIVITGGSINGTTIGATTPSTGKFTTLEATGVTTVQAGTVSAPAITTSGDTNTGIFFPAADTIAFTEGGAEAMRIDSSGRVGIGTSSPAFLTEIVGGATTVETTLFQVRSNAGGIGTGTTIALGNSTSTTAGSGRVELAAIRTTASGGSFVIRTGDDSGNIQERMRIDSSGNVGIGTSTITSGAGWTPTLVLSATSAALVVKGVNGQENSFGNSNGLYIDCLGNSTATNNNIIFRNTASNSSYSATERMRITSSGHVLVGTTSENTSGGVLQVSNGITFPATQSASSDANTLDDYEEGTFTPSVAGASTTGTATYSARYGIYTKIGRLVQFEIYLGWSGGTGAGNFYVTGLPFTVRSSNTFPAVTVAYPNGIALSANHYIYAYCNSGDSFISIGQGPVGGGGIGAVQYDAAGEIILCGSYAI